MKTERLKRNEIGWLNLNIEMRPYMEMQGAEIKQNSQCFCPFHDNTSTPAAKFFDSSNSMHCFAEGRTYRTYDLLKLMDWSADDMRKLIPDEFTYEEEQHVLEIPRITDDIRKEFKGKTLIFMREMNRMWNRLKDEKTSHTVDKIIL